jgi:hypothetical protein
MRPIPPDRRARLSADPRYTYCSIPDEYCETGKIDWHHVWIYAGQQVDEDWAILSACQYHHRFANRPDIQRRFQRESLSRATDADLARYPHKNWAQIKRYLANTA